MSVPKWEVVEVTSGDLQAEILRGLLEAQGIPTMLSREGAGRAYGLGVGPMGEVQILVPSDQLENARAVMEAYNAGTFDTPED